tara:strand:- start:2150 stop:3337 length:1188 start_codon:yes stop_codon:yes gene_type:complete
MKIIGYNSSHETSLCQFDNETWEIDFLYEEERFRRKKYWTPEFPNDELLCIPHKGVEKPDEFVGASYDRRCVHVELDHRALQYDFDGQRKVKAFLREAPLTKERLLFMMEEFKPWVINYDKDKQFLTENHHCRTDVDDSPHGRVADQLGMDEFHYEIQHHLYHAECGYFYSPWKEKEPAIAITMDGGGAKMHQEDWVDYQEVETIFRCEPNKVPQRQWGRLTNNRAVEEYQKNYLYNTEKGKIFPEDVTVEIDGVPQCFSSYPSMGMNFSQLSVYFGFDRLGRAAGKVMGAASYHEWQDNEDGYVDYTVHSICNQLQQKSFDFTCKIIQRAIDLNPDCKNIILSGGFALNCTNNAKYLDKFPDYQFFVDPVAHDGGTAVGAAIRLGRALKQGEDI